jgi:hypothetical protein
MGKSLLHVENWDSISRPNESSFLERLGGSIVEKLRHKHRYQGHGKESLSRETVMASLKN